MGENAWEIDAARSHSRQGGIQLRRGSKNFRFATRASHSGLYEHIVLGRGLQPRDGYFLRAESFYNVATEIENVADGVLKYYGDKSLHQQSHGESFWRCSDTGLSDTDFIFSTSRKPHCPRARCTCCAG